MKYIITLFKQLFTLLSFSVLISGCSEVEKPLLYKVKEQEFSIIIPAKGEL